MGKEIRTKQTAEAFGIEWTRWGNVRRLYKDERAMEEEFGKHGIPDSFFKGKVVLDAGCGMGRWSYLALKRGAKEVYGIDLHDGIKAARMLTKRFPNAQFMKASIFKLPFRPESFDSIMSVGVLHHTGDTHKAFKSLVRLLRPGGQIFVMVYERRNIMFDTFNPLIRKVTTRIPKRLLYYLCFLAVAIGYIPLIRQLMYVFNVNVTTVGVSPKRTFWRNVADTYDWHCCPHQDMHTYGEMLDLFRECGLEDIRVTNPDYRDAINMIGRKPAGR